MLPKIRRFAVISVFLTTTLMMVGCPAPSPAPAAPATTAATEAATEAPTEEATEAATIEATEAVTGTMEATEAATEEATEAATVEATEAVTGTVEATEAVTGTMEATEAVTGTVEATTAPTGTAVAEATISVGDSSLGEIIKDEAGRTLYAFKNDTGGTSTCYGSCAQNWPPLLTTGSPQAGTGVDATLLGTTERTDGTTQVTYMGMPLYYFARDTAAGDVNGQGVGEVWYVVSPTGKMIET